MGQRTAAHGHMRHCKYTIPVAYFSIPIMQHTHAGYAKYMRGGKTITSNWTGYLPSPAYFPASDKEEATVSCWDSLGWNDPKTIFHYSFE